MKNQFSSILENSFSTLFIHVKASTENRILIELKKQNSRMQQKKPEKSIFQGDAHKWNM